MVITDHFVYLHMPKSGGTFVEKMLRDLLHGCGGLHIDTSDAATRSAFGGTDHHETVVQIPPPHRHKKVLFSIRNPYDHYVSHFEFGWWKTHPASFFNDARATARYPSYPNLAFGNFLHAINEWDLHPGTDPGIASLFEQRCLGFITFEVLRFLFDDPLQVVESLDDYAERGRLAAALPSVHFLRTDQLNADLYAFLRSIGYEEERLRFILQAGKVFPAEGGRREDMKWEGYYSEEMKQFVRARDRVVFAAIPAFDTQSLATSACV